MVALAVGIRVLLGAAAMLVGTARQLLVEQARRRTLLAVSQAVPEGSVLVDKRPDGSKLTLRTGAATVSAPATEARR